MTAGGARRRDAPGAALRDITASLRHRNFRLFFIGQTISNTGNWLTMVVLTLLVLHRGGTGVDVGILTACQFGPILVLSAWAGVVVDRSDKLRMLWLTQSLEMVQSAVLAVLAFSPGVPVWGFDAATLVGGCLLAFDNPVRRTFVSEMVPRADVPNAVTLYSMMVNLSRVAGPALAGLLVLRTGFGWCFVVDTVSYAAVLAALAMMRRSELLPTPGVPRGAGQVRAGVRYVRTTPELHASFVMLLIVGTLSYNFPVLFPLLVERTLHGSDAMFTVLYSVLSVGSVVGGLLVARRREVTLATVATGAGWLGAALLVLSLAPTFSLALVVTAAVGAAAVSFMTATTAMVQLRSTPQMLGRVLALQAVLFIGTTPLGGPLMGALADAAGTRVAIALGGVAALGAAALGVVARRRVASATSAASTA